MEKMMSNVYFQKQIHKLQAFVKSVFSTVNEGLSVHNSTFFGPNIS
jgi:hypothetical protein